MASFHCNTTENVIFFLKYCHKNFDLNVSKKSLVFVTIRKIKFHPYDQLSYTKVSYLPKNTHLRRDATFFTFSFEGKFRK